MGLRDKKPIDKDYGRRPQANHHDSFQEMMREKTVFQRQNEAPFKHSEFEKPFLGDKDYEDRERTFSPPKVNTPPNLPYDRLSFPEGVPLENRCLCKGMIVQATPGVIEAGQVASLWAGVGKTSFFWDAYLPMSGMLAAGGSLSSTGTTGAGLEGDYVDMVAEAESAWAARIGCPEMIGETAQFSFNITRVYEWATIEYGPDPALWPISGCSLTIPVVIKVQDGEVETGGVCFGETTVVAVAPSCQLALEVSGPIAYTPGDTFEVASNCLATEWSVSGSLGTGGTMRKSGSNLIVETAADADCQLDFTATTSCVGAETITVLSSSGGWSARKALQSCTCVAGWCINTYETIIDGFRYVNETISWSEDVQDCSGCSPNVYQRDKLINVRGACTIPGCESADCNSKWLAGTITDCQDCVGPCDGDYNCTHSIQNHLSFYQEWEC
jgi:hypothetical protein